MRKRKSDEQISFNMKQVKNKDSKIERLLRKELWARGLRYRKNVNRIYGKPDIVFIGKKIAVFCDSEFLWNNGIIAAPNGPRPFTKITNEQFEMILKESNTEIHTIGE